MQIYNFVFEKFTFKPRNVKLFFENLSKRILKYEHEIISSYEEINKFLEEDESYERRDKEYYLDNILAPLASYSFDDLKYQVKNFKRNINRNNEHLTSRVQNLFSLAKSNSRSADFLKYIIQDLKFFQEDFENFYQFSNKILENLNELESEIIDNNHILPHDLYLSIKNLAIAVNELGKLIIEFAIPKLERLQQTILAYDEKDLEHKNLEDVETLYHASTNAKEIFENGFRKNVTAQEIEGIGGHNRDKAGNFAISFTADLYIAKEIARCLKEAILIAQGKIDIYDLKTLAMQAGVADTIDLNWPIYSEEKNLERLTINQIFDYYRYYLAYSDRYDPVFFDSSNLMNVFKNKTVENVGILVCKVNMKDPNIKYLESMEEYRVAPESVISIENLLR